MLESCDGREALERLREGNRRFVAGEGTRDLAEEHARRRQSIEAQAPFAIVLGCSDARVPAEIVFDQGLGDLFVIRVAGNIVAPSQVGSIEFAADRFGVRLVVVLGHSQCGAITATLESLAQPATEASPNLGFIVSNIRSAIEPLIGSGNLPYTEELVSEAVRANIRASARHLREESEVLQRLMAEEGLLIVGAEYSLETGVVDFFDGAPRLPASR